MLELHSPTLDRHWLTQLHWPTQAIQLSQLTQPIQLTPVDTMALQLSDTTKELEVRINVFNYNHAHLQWIHINKCSCQNVLWCSIDCKLHSSFPAFVRSAKVQTSEVKAKQLVTNQQCETILHHEINANGKVESRQSNVLGMRRDLLPLLPLMTPWTRSRLDLLEHSGILIYLNFIGFYGINSSRFIENCISHSRRLRIEAFCKSRIQNVQASKLKKIFWFSIINFGWFQAFAVAALLVVANASPVPEAKADPQVILTSVPAPISWNPWSPIIAGPAPLIVGPHPWVLPSGVIVAPPQVVQANL